MSAMSTFARIVTLAAVAGLAALTGCGTAPAGQPSPSGSATAPSPGSTAPSPGSTAPSPGATTPGAGATTPSPGGTSAGTCQQPGSHLTAIRVGQYAGYDRVVFQFSGGLPARSADYVQAVYHDPKGTVVPLPGQAYLRVVFQGASAVCGQQGRTYTGPPVLTPYYPELLAVSAAGDFEGYLSFGIGLAAQGGYHLYTLTAPDRVVIDISHVKLAAFPGIWDITSWPGYWSTQYAWLNGHQPWRSDPLMVVQAWARSRWPGTTPAVTQTGAGTFKVTAPSGRVYTVAGARPVTTPGPWVITTVVPGPLPV